MTSTSGSTSCATTGRLGAWPTTRLLFLLAGTATLVTVVLAVTVSSWFLLLTSLVGLNQLVYVVTGACPASLAIERARATSTSPR